LRVTLIYDSPRVELLAKPKEIASSPLALLLGCGAGLNRRCNQLRSHQPGLSHRHRNTGRRSRSGDRRGKFERLHAQYCSGRLHSESPQAPLQIVRSPPEISVHEQLQPGTKHLRTFDLSQFGKTFVHRVQVGAECVELLRQRSAGSYNLFCLYMLQALRHNGVDRDSGIESSHFFGICRRRLLVSFVTTSVEVGRCVQQRLRESSHGPPIERTVNVVLVGDSGHVVGPGDLVSQCGQVDQAQSRVKTNLGGRTNPNGIGSERVNGMDACRKAKTLEFDDQMLVHLAVDIYPFEFEGEGANFQRFVRCGMIGYGIKASQRILVLHNETFEFDGHAVRVTPRINIDEKVQLIAEYLRCARTRPRMSCRHHPTKNRPV